MTAAGLDDCTLANYHVLDWGHTGLDDTPDRECRELGTGVELTDERTLERHWPL